MGKLLELEIEIKNKRALHLSAAALICKKTKNAKGDITIRYNDKKADGKDLIDIVSLGCTQGSKIQITIENQDDKEILEELQQVIDNKFFEKE